MSLRRGSALAAMGNGALLVTTPATTEKELLQKICVMSADDDGLIGAVLRALDSDAAFEVIRRAGQEFARTTSWAAVTASYITVMNRFGVWLQK